MCIATLAPLGSRPPSLRGVVLPGTPSEAASLTPPPTLAAGRRFDRHPLRGGLTPSEEGGHGGVALASAAVQLTILIRGLHAPATTTTLDPNDRKYDGVMLRPRYSGRARRRRAS